MNRRGGFTLIEVLIVLAVLSVLIFLAASIYIDSIVSSGKELKRASLQSQIKSINDGMVKNIKVSSGVDSSYDTFTFDSEHLILKVPAVDSSTNEFIYEEDNLKNDRIVYYKDGNELKKKIYSGNPSSKLYPQNGNISVLTSDLKTISFTCLPNLSDCSLVEISATLEDTSGDPTIERSVNTKVKMRNKSEDET